MRLNYTLSVILFISVTTTLRYALEGKQGLYIGLAALLVITPIAIIIDLVSWSRRHRGRQRH